MPTHPSERLEVVPMSLHQARAFVVAHHRHHGPPKAHKFSLGVARGGQLVGVAIVARPVSRMLDNGLTLEVSRTCTDGARNANSMLYAASWRAARALGYSRLITYTQAGEGGASLRAAGWQVVAERRPRTSWDRPSRPRQPDGTEHIRRTLWEAS